MSKKFRWRLMIPGIYLLLCALGYIYLVVMWLPGMCTSAEGFRCAAIPMIPLAVLGLPWVIWFGHPGASDVLGIAVPIVINAALLFGIGMVIDARKSRPN